MRFLCVLVLLSLLAVALAHERHLESYKHESNQKKFTGTELLITDDMPVRSEGVGFSLISPEGRGSSENWNTKGPCGQFRLHTGSLDRVEWATDQFVYVDVLVLDANGGGVVTQFFGYGPDPQGPLLSDWHNDHLRFIVPDEDNKLYRIKIRTPPLRFEGPGTIQLVYNSLGRETQEGFTSPKTYFQCIDVVLDAPASVLSVSFTLFGAVLSLAFLVL